MKRKQAKSLFDKNILSMGDGLADLIFEAQLLIHTHKVVRTGETIAYNSGTRAYTHHSIGDWWNSISADDLTQKLGCTHFYLGARKGDKHSITGRYLATLNSQFRWLLVSGLETYERFLVRLYAELGYCDPNLWRCADFGNRYHMKDISSLSLDKFVQRVRECPDLQPEKIRNLLGSIFPTVQRCEDKNSIISSNAKISYRDYIELISETRHIIVHEQSQIQPDELFNRLGRKWKNKCELSKELKTLIVHNELKHSSTGWEIWLLDKSPSSQESCAQFDGPLRILLERLGTHACLLYGEAIKHFGHKPFWERK